MRISRFQLKLTFIFLIVLLIPAITSTLLTQYIITVERKFMGEDVDETVSRELREETGLELVRIKHISAPVFSSAGLTDESCHMVLAEARGEVSDEWLEDSEDIEVLLLDIGDIKDLLASNKKIAAKAWGLLRHYVQTGRID